METAIRQNSPPASPVTVAAQRTPDRASVWDAIWAQRGMVPRSIAAVRASLHALHRRVLDPYLHPAASLLELGCGPATLTLSMAHRVQRLTGLDISPEALRQAQENATRLGVTNATFVRGDCRAVPFRDAFPIVWSAGLIEHFFEEDLAVVRQHLAAAMPGGIVLMSVPATWSLHHLHYLLSRPWFLRWLWPWSDVRHFQKFYAPWQLRRLGKATGLPALVYYLPPAPVGFLLGILILEIRKPAHDPRNARTS